MLPRLLHELLTSRHIATDAIRRLWVPLKRVVDSPFVDAGLQQRLRTTLACMTYWADNPNGEASGADVAIAKLLLNLMPPKSNTDESGRYDFGGGGSAEDEVTYDGGSVEDEVKYDDGGTAENADVAMASTPTVVVAAISTASTSTSASALAASASASASGGANVAPASSTDKLVDLVRDALVTQTRGTAGQAAAWKALVATLLVQAPDLGSKKRKLQALNPLRGDNLKVQEKIKEKKAKLDFADVARAEAAEDAKQSATLLQSAFMDTDFHAPPPLAQIFSEPRMALLQQIFPERPIQIPTTAVQFHALLEALRAKLSAGPPTRYVVDRKRHHDRKHRHPKAAESGSADPSDPFSYQRGGGRGGGGSGRGGRGGFGGYGGTYGISSAAKMLDKADTMKALYAPSAALDIQIKPIYVEALRLLGALEGRFKQYVEKGGIRAEAALLDKSGLATVAISADDLAADLPTSVFVVLAALEFSARKAFTLQAQQQGALNPALTYMLRSLEVHEDKAAWPLVFHVYPNATTLAHLTILQKQALFDQWMEYLPLLVRFLQAQWDAGVSACANKLMLVPRRGGGVDSDGWNRVAGAWNNALRFVRLLATDLPDRRGDKFTLFKCLKLTAGDQMAWAESDGKGADGDTLVFRDLVVAPFASAPLDSSALSAGAGAGAVAGAASSATTAVAVPFPLVMPWSGLVKPIEGLRAHIEQLCVKHGVAPHKWLGKAQARTSSVIKEHVPMICGVAVGALTTDQAAALKAAGFAGSSL